MAKFLIETNCCRAKSWVDEVTDADAQVTCDDDCAQCPEDHHHGQNANATGEACRPITIWALEGSLEMAPATPGSV